MEKLPHQYCVRVQGSPQSTLEAHADNLPPIQVAPPAKFDGPGDKWSPEELLMASLANCLILSFRPIAKASNFDWLTLECTSNGTLDKVGHKIQFTSVQTKVRLTVPSAKQIEKAKRLLNKAEETCFISNTLSCPSHLESEIVVDG
jgi:organic hydroperoxide reductase OsmC/OhrA